MPGIWCNCYTGYFIWWLFAVVLSQFVHDYFCAFVIYMFWKLNLRLYTVQLMGNMNLLLQGDADSALDRLWAKKKAELGQ
jgi:hypothetical protein